MKWLLSMLRPKPWGGADTIVGIELVERFYAMALFYDCNARQRALQVGIGESEQQEPGAENGSQGVTILTSRQIAGQSGRSDRVYLLDGFARVGKRSGEDGQQIPARGRGPHQDPGGPGDRGRGQKGGESAVSSGGSRES